MEPVSNRSSSRSLESNAADLESRDPPPEALTSQAPVSSSLEPDPGVRALTSGYRSPPAAFMTPKQATPPSENNALRTNQRDSTAAYAASGRTLQGDTWTGAAALKTREPRSGVAAEVFTASAQLGTQTELQAGLARVGLSGAYRGTNVSVAVDTISVRVNGGTQNDDGSKGANVGAMATAAGIEATLEYSGWAATAGLSISAGVAVSSGERDADGDGVPERCFKASIGPATIGFCSEFR
jgi:hypothetical protein